MTHITQEQIRATGGIVHRDGNIFFTNIDQLNAALAQPASEPDMGNPISQSEPVIKAPKANMFHDAGAMAQCGCCKRYTLDGNAIGFSDARQPVCTCGQQHYWSGSFKPPGPDAQWHGPAPTTEQSWAVAPAAPTGEPG